MAPLSTLLTTLTDAHLSETAEPLALLEEADRRVIPTESLPLPQGSIKIEAELPPDMRRLKSALKRGCSTKRVRFSEEVEFGTWTLEADHASSVASRSSMWSDCWRGIAASLYAFFIDVEPDDDLHSTKDLF